MTKSKVAKIGINNLYGRIEYSGIGYYENKKAPDFYFTYAERNKNNDIIQQHTTHSKDNIQKKVYQNEYLPMILHKGDEFKIRVFDHIKKRDNLSKDINMHGVHLGFKPNTPATFGLYESENKLFKFNTDCPFLNHRPFYINTAEHELKHAKQVEKVDLLNLGKLTGKRAKKAQKYKSDFDNYTNFDFDEKKYRKQIVEKEALQKGRRKQNLCDKLISLLQQKFQKGKLLVNQLDYNSM